MTIQEVLQDYPDLEEDDILACIAYCAEMSRERYVEIPLGHDGRGSNSMRILALVALSCSDKPDTTLSLL